MSLLETMCKGYILSGISNIKQHDVNLYLKNVTLLLHCSVLMPVDDKNVIRPAKGLCW